MTTFILRVDPNTFDRNNPIFTKVGNPQMLTELVIVESYASMEEIRSVRGVLDVGEDQVEEPDTSRYAVNNSWGMKYIDAPGSGEGVDVFILDSGVRSSHEFFKGKEIIHFWSADDKEYDANETAGDHGTKCCAMVLATAPKARIYSMRTKFITSNTIKCLDMCAKHHSENPDRNTVVSMSFSSDGPFDYYSTAVSKRLADMGVVMVASAGNRSADYPGTPAASDGVFAIGAIDKDGNIASFSSGKKGGVDFWAPGVSLASPGVKTDVQYTTFSGTSASTPIVAGVIASALTGSEKLISREGIYWVRDQLRGNSIGEYPGGGGCPRAIGYGKTYKQPLPPPVVEEPELPDPTPPAPEPPIEETPPPAKKKKKKNYTPFIFGGVALVVIAFVVYHNFMGVA